MTARFLEASARYLTEEYLPRIQQLLETLPREDLWWRPHEASTSVGNLLLHLEGNVRQWILSGLGGTEDQRRRAEEFRVDHEESAEVLYARLEQTAREAATVIRGLDPHDLDAVCVIQGFETTIGEAVYHVVEHFSWHTGQMTWIAKCRAGARHGLAFYDEEAINRATNE